MTTVTTAAVVNVIALPVLLSASVPRARLVPLCVYVQPVLTSQAVPSVTSTVKVCPSCDVPKDRYPLDAALIVNAPRPADATAETVQRRRFTWVSAMIYQAS